METNELLSSMFSGSMETNGMTSANTTITSTSLTGGSTTYTLPALQEWMSTVFVEHANSGYQLYDPVTGLNEGTIDQISSLISKLSDTENENQLNAVKHLTYAKAYLDKILLDTLNQKL
jgi:hypothetical protein